MIFEVAILSFFLAGQPRKCNTFESGVVVVFDSNTTSIEWKPEYSLIPEVSVAGNLEAALAKDLASIPEVRHVLTERAEGNLLVWIAIDNAESYEVRSQVYEKELGLMDGFPEVSFDFNLMPAMGRNAKELATGAQVVYTRP
jgi:hypothetical protein